MPFAYYDNLTRRQQAIYRRSDRVTEIRLSSPEALQPQVAALEQALAAADRRAITAACGKLCRGICRDQAAEPVSVRVLARRPASATEELHGLYEMAEGRPARITVWMRTAARKQVVAFRTFLRTLLHELCHHLDYTSLGLADSFHTQGFFSRESSLLKQLVEAVPARTRGAAKPEPRKPRGRKSGAEQLDLF